MARLEAPTRRLVDVLRLAASYLEAHGSPTPRLDAELLLGYVVAMTRLELYLHHDRPLDDSELGRYRSLLRRRAQHEPVAYLIGSWGFRGLTLSCDARALVPRAETELLVDIALAALPDGGRLLDLGTGSGAIALSVALERPDADVTGLDVSTDALALAGINAGRLGAAGVRLLQSDLYDALGDERFDVIAANLPYVAVGDACLERSVREHEPALAVFGDDDDGLRTVRRALRDASRHLEPGGLVVLEVGAGQAGAVAAFATAAALTRVATLRDLAGIERFVTAQRPEQPGR